MLLLFAHARIHFGAKKHGRKYREISRLEVTYNAALLISLWHHVDPKYSVASGFQCTSLERMNELKWFNWLKKRKLAH